LLWKGNRGALLGVGILVSLCTPTAADGQAGGKAVGIETYRVFRAFYDYDRTLPLHASITHEEVVAAETVTLPPPAPPVVEEIPAHRRISISYMNNGKERVPAILWLPQDEKPRRPCILFIPGLGATKLAARPYAHELVKRGYAVFAIDPALQGDRAPGKPPLSLSHVYRLRDSLMQTVIDCRRGLDYLQSRDDIDPEHLSVIGVDTGAVEGAILAAVDARIRCPALLTGWADWGIMARNSQLSAWKAVRGEDAALDAAELSNILAPADALNFVDKVAPRPLLLIHGMKDEIVPKAAAQLLHKTARDPKEVIWLDTGHALRFETVVAQLAAWFSRHL